MARRRRPGKLTTYSKYTGGWLDLLNLQSLVEHLSDFLLDGGFAGGPHYHPFWGWSGAEDTQSSDALKGAILNALLESGELTPEMIAELRGEGEGDEEMQRNLAKMLDEIVQRMVEEGYINLDTGTPQMPGTARELGPEGDRNEAREAASGVEFGLTRKGMDFLGYRALRQLLAAMGQSSAGVHRTAKLATGIEAESASRPYEFGDALNLDVVATLKRAIEREGLGLPIRLEPRDLMVNQAEYRSSCATVLMLDVSHSMVLYGEDRFTPAKRVALALSHMLRMRFPGDTLRVVTFGDRASELPLAKLAKAQVGPFHTNTAEGLQVARRILRAQRKDMRQIVMITDGKPSAMTLPNGQVYVNSGAFDPMILARTFKEVSACRKSGIAVNTFMLARDPYLVSFVREVARIARGKAYFTSTMTLGEHIVKGFLKRRMTGEE